MKEVSYTAQLTGSLVLSKEGVWIHNGVPFQNQKLSLLFFRSIQWSEEENEYFVYIGNQRAKFTKEDTAYFVVSLSTDSIPWSLLLSDQTTEPLDPNSLSLGAENQIYCSVKGGHRARLLRGPHQIMLQHAISESEIEIGDKKFKISK